MRAFSATEITHSGGSSEPDMNACHAADLAAYLRGHDGNAGDKRRHDLTKAMVGYRVVCGGATPRSTSLNNTKPVGTRQGTPPFDATVREAHFCQ